MLSVMTFMNTLQVFKTDYSAGNYEVEGSRVFVNVVRYGILPVEAHVLALQVPEWRCRNRMRFIPKEDAVGVGFDVGALWRRGKNEQLVEPFVEALAKSAELSG